MLINEITNKFAHLDDLSPEEKQDRIERLQHIDKMSSSEKDELAYLSRHTRQSSEPSSLSDLEIYQRMLDKSKEQLQKAIDSYESSNSEMTRNMLKGFMIPKLMDSIKKYQDLVDQNS